MNLPQEQEEILHNNHKTNSKNHVSGKSQNIETPKSEKHHNAKPVSSDKSNSTANTPPETPPTTARNSVNSGSGLFTLFESDSNNADQHENKTHVNNVNGNLTVPTNGLLQPMVTQKSSSQAPKKRDAPRTRPVTVHGPPSGSQDFISVSRQDSKTTNNFETTPSKPNTSSASSIPPSIPLPPIPSRRESLPPVMPPANGQKKHKRGLSSEKIFKFLGNQQQNGKDTTTISVDTTNNKKESEALSQPAQSALINDMPSDTASDSTSAIDDNSDSKSKRRASKRKALSLMVDTFKGPAGHSTHSVVSGSNVQVKDKRKSVAGTSAGSSNAAKKVMDWFRRKSLGKLNIVALYNEVAEYFIIIINSYLISYMLMLPINLFYS